MTDISYKVWTHPSPKAVFLLVHGLGSNPSWWESLALTFLKNSYSSYAIDLRICDSFKAFEDGVKSLRNIIKKELPDKKIFILGESLGGLVEISVALKEKDMFSGLISMSPAFKSTGVLNLSDYINIFLPLLYNPQKKYRLPVSPDMCTRDPDYAKRIEADYDKDVLSTSRILFDIFLVQLRFRFSKIDLNLPILFLVAGDDKLVESEASRRFFKKLKLEDKTLIEYPRMYHSLSVDLEKEKVFQDILNWVEGRI